MAELIPDAGLLAHKQRASSGSHPGVQKIPLEVLVRLVLEADVVDKVTRPSKWRPIGCDI